MMHYELYVLIKTCVIPELKIIVLLVTAYILQEYIDYRIITSQYRRKLIKEKIYKRKSIKASLLPI